MTFKSNYILYIQIKNNNPMKKIKRKKHKSKKILKKKRINKKATTENVIKWVVQNPEKGFDVENFNSAMIKFDWETKLVAFAKENKIVIVYN